MSKSSDPKYASKKEKRGVRREVAVEADPGNFQLLRANAPEADCQLGAVVAGGAKSGLRWGTKDRALSATPYKTK